MVLPGRLRFFVISLITASVLFGSGLVLSNSLLTGVGIGVGLGAFIAQVILLAIDAWNSPRRKY